MHCLYVVCCVADGMYEAEMMPKTRRRLRRLLWILGTAVLVLFMGYKAGFGSLGRSDRDGKGVPSRPNN